MICNGLCLFSVALVCKKSSLSKFKCGDFAQLVFSCSLPRCFGTLVPMNGFAEVLNNIITVLVTHSDLEKCCVSLVGSKLVPPLRSSVVLWWYISPRLYSAPSSPCSAASRFNATAGRNHYHSNAMRWESRARVKARSSGPK